MTPRTRRDKRALRLAYLILALLPVAAWASGKAHADPETVNDYAFRNATVICALLGQDHSDAGIEAVVAILEAHGVTPYQSGMVIGLAVKNVCPKFTGRVLDWAHTPSTISPVYAS